ISIENGSELVRWTNDHANVSDLSTALSVERRVIEHDLALFTFAQRFDFITLDHSNDLRISDARHFVALEQRSRKSSRKVGIDWIRFGFRLALVSRRCVL